MSATIESDLFSMYFAVPVRGRVEGAPVVSVDGKSFHVVESYLDDLRDIGVSLRLIPFYSSCLYKKNHLLSVLKSEQILFSLKKSNSVSKMQGQL